METRSGVIVPAQPSATAGSAPWLAEAKFPPSRDFFEKFELLERVAGGGQGEIWKVWDIELRRTIAMKRLSQASLESEPARYRFLAEAQITSQLEHPGILPIFDVGLDPDGRPFYTTSLLLGTTIADVWRDVQQHGPEGWTIPRALELMLHVCDTMAHAHSRGVIHRDLKPTNILVGPYGDVRVIDWGSAHILPTALGQFADPFVPLNQEVVQTDRGAAMSSLADSPLATSVGGLPFTPYFVPPEVLCGKAADFGPATDIYSLGVMLYELLAGRMPYSNANGPLLGANELRTLVAGGSPPPIRSINPKASRDLAAIASKAMAHAQGERYQSMEALADDIRAALAVRPVQARQPGPMLVLQKWVQRNAALVLLGVLCLGIASAAFAIQRGLRAERNVARQVTALRSAELATRSGQWREALQYWAEAETAGYGDAVNLGLQRAEAWTVLAEPDQARAALQKLMRRRDLGEQRGAVLLRFGEHELYDRQTFKQGVAHVREAQGCRLPVADQAFAQGLLAETTPEALKWFRQALQLDPYHHGAHVHSLGLEYLLGQRQDLRTHAQVCRILFPDDPSAGFLEASALAFQGQLAEARARLASLPSGVNPDALKQFEAFLKMQAGAADDYDVEAIIEKGRKSGTNRESFDAYENKLLANAITFETVSQLGKFRTPQLPSLQAGLLEGAAAIATLFLPTTNSIEPVVQKIKASWHCHPEATLPFLAANLLAKRQPSDGPKSLPLLVAQADLYQLAAGSASVIPGLGRTARYLAIQAQCELALSKHPAALEFRLRCLENLRRAADASDTSLAECPLRASAQRRHNR